MRDLINRMARRVPAWPLYILGVVPVAYLFWLGINGGLGAEPIKALEQKIGGIGLQLLVAGLAITPLRRFFGINLIKFRRAIGLLVFFYIVVHLLVWLLIDVQDMARIWQDILKRPYITIGMVGFICMVPLAVTSNNWSVRRLGPVWRRLHRLTYIVAVLGAVYFVMLVKGFQVEPLVYLAVILGLLATRVPKRRKSAAV
ncbi:MAG: protein-methionine-sulfoxide reductase heme-binding subunit MsrQ [Rhodobacterales bacterium]|nr:protein-methionine-sulfoxide reductase heme-binding subunit MsrQ [Rhodobacterales bacterium]